MLSACQHVPFSESSLKCSKASGWFALQKLVCARAFREKGSKHYNLILLCREYFRELVLDNNGRLRWQRLENLIEEGSKSLDYDPQQLWLLAAWVLGEQGAPVRKPLVEELARLMDAAVASETFIFWLNQNFSIRLLLLFSQPHVNLSCHSLKDCRAWKQWMVLPLNVIAVWSWKDNHIQTVVHT